MKIWGCVGGTEMYRRPHGILCGHHRMRRIRLTPTVKLMVLLSVLSAVLLILPALGADGSGQVSLSIYVDDDFGKALVVGYIDDSECLPFLNDSGQIYEEDT